MLAAMHHARATLREQGYRLTPQRNLIWEVLRDAGRHLTAEEVAAEVRRTLPDVNVSTVYRTLELLEQLGLVTKTEMGVGRIMYHPIEKGHHHHLICRECGSIVDLDESIMSPLKETLLRDYQFTAELRHLGILGLCADCKQKLPIKPENG